MKVVAKTDKNGKIMYSSDILNSIVQCATEEVEGFVRYQAISSKISKRYKNGVKIETINDYIYIDVFVKLYHYVKVKEVSFVIQESIKNTIESMTDFKIKDINVHVVDIEFASLQISQPQIED
ncbi:MAG: Asp23/Gls24 family envelope stress response protein [Clostridia bacterium]